jgi:hypothetical protein
LPFKQCFLFKASFQKGWFDVVNANQFNYSFSEQISNGFPDSIKVQISIANVSLNLTLEQDQGLLNTMSLKSRVLGKINQNYENLNTYNLVHLKWLKSHK